MTYDEDANVIGDLATSWEMSPDGLTWTFEIVDNAYFINRTNPYSTEHPLTIDDVIFMVDWAFNHGPIPACVDEADVNGVDGVNIEDLVYLVECVFHAGDEPVTCY